MSLAMRLLGCSGWLLAGQKANAFSFHCWTGGNQKSLEHRFSNCRLGLQRGVKRPIGKCKTKTFFFLNDTDTFV